jgi:uncharacterized membrane protein
MPIFLVVARWSAGSAALIEVRANVGKGPGGGSFGEAHRWTRLDRSTASRASRALGTLILVIATACQAGSKRSIRLSEIADSIGLRPKEMKCISLGKQDLVRGSPMTYCSVTRSDTTGLVALDQAGDLASVAIRWRVSSASASDHFAAIVASLEKRYGVSKKGCAFAEGAAMWKLDQVTLLAEFLPRQGMIELGYSGEDPSPFIDCESLYHWTQVFQDSLARKPPGAPTRQP